jgi:pimeloyl-ACP methyl ester carboxylesterase
MTAALPSPVGPHPDIPETPRLPAGTAGQFALVNGSPIWYACWDSNSSALQVPVLLLHGGLLNSNYFGALIPALIAEHYTVIAMDSRGQGRSSYPGGAITYKLMEQDVLALLDHLRIPAVSIIGWSDGGIIGLELAIEHPDRVRRVFAFGANTVPAGNIEGADSLPVVMAHAACEQQEYQALSAHPEYWPQVRSAINHMWATLPNITSTQLQSIRVPITIADGQHDEFIKPEHTRYVAAQIPGARLEIIPHTSHFAMIQEPDTFNHKVLEFLSR